MLPSVTIDSHVSVADKGKKSKSERRRSIKGKVKGSSHLDKHYLAKKNWDKLFKKVTLYLTVLETWQHTKEPITYRLKQKFFESKKITRKIKLYSQGIILDTLNTSSPKRPVAAVS